MAINTNVSDSVSIPVMSGREFRFIRIHSGLTLKRIAQIAHKYSRSTIFYWERQWMMKPHQTDLLMKLTSPAVFEAGRVAFLEFQHQKRRKKRRRKIINVSN